MDNANAYCAASATSPLASTTIRRRDPTEHDVQIELLFCGICHSDLFAASRPLRSRPGHEVVGRVTKVGSPVTKVQTRRPRGRWLPG